MTFFRLIFENASRNLLRTLLTALGTMMLVFVVTLVWSILEFLQLATEERTSNIKAVVSEKWSLPSQMPYAYASGLVEGAVSEPTDVKPLDSMTWTFYFGTTETDIRKKSWDNSLFAFVMEPSKLLTMMDDLDNLPPGDRDDWAKTVKKLEDNPQGIILGKNRLESLQKRIGDRFTLTGVNYRGIDLEVEVVGTFPVARYDTSAALHVDYFNRTMDAYEVANKGQKHPLHDRSLNLVWLRVPDTKAFTQLAHQITSSPSYTSPAVKVETSSSGIATFLEAYRDLIWGMRFLLGPAIIITLALVISNAISISVRERRMEFAVLKVLGFQPFQILGLVLGEALLIGAVSGGLSAGLTYYIVNEIYRGIGFPIAFFAKFTISDWAPIWGLTIGTAAAFVGSFLPAWNACRVKVAEVFGRVT